MPRKKCPRRSPSGAADEIAYTAHDLDDGIRSGLLAVGQLEAEPLWREIRSGARERLGDVAERVLDAQTIVALLNLLATDLIEATSARVESAGVQSADDVRGAGTRLVGLSKRTERRFRALKRFVRENLYEHPQVVGASREAERVVADLYHAYRKDASRVPDNVVDRFETDGEARAVADYIAGMTDRFATAAHQRLAQP